MVGQGPPCFEEWPLVTTPLVFSTCARHASPAPSPVWFPTEHTIFSGGRNLLSFRQKAVFGQGLLADHQELKYLLVPFYYNLGLSITQPSPGRLQRGRTSVSKPCLWSPNNEAVWAAEGNRVYRDCFYGVLYMFKFPEKTEKLVSRKCWEWGVLREKISVLLEGTNDCYYCLVPVSRISKGSLRV